MNAEIEERKVQEIEAPCRMCGGVGFNQWEPECENCFATGRVLVEIYQACQCPVEECECEMLEDCNEITLVGAASQC